MNDKLAKRALLVALLSAAPALFITAQAEPGDLEPVDYGSVPDRPYPPNNPYLQNQTIDESEMDDNEFGNEVVDDEDLDENSLEELDSGEDADQDYPQ